MISHYICGRAFDNTKPVEELQKESDLHAIDVNRHQQVVSDNGYKLLSATTELHVALRPNHMFWMTTLVYEDSHHKT